MQVAFYLAGEITLLSFRPYTLGLLCLWQCLSKIWCCRDFENCNLSKLLLDKYVRIVANRILSRIRVLDSTTHSRTLLNDFDFQSCFPLAMNTAQRDFLDATLKLYKEGESTDANIVCQGIEKPVHSAVLVARYSIELSSWVP